MIDGVHFTDDEIADILAAFDSAAIEGAFSNRELAQKILAEADRRGILTLPYAYHGEASPKEWIKGTLLNG